MTQVKPLKAGYASRRPEADEGHKPVEASAVRASDFVALTTRAGKIRLEHLGLPSLRADLRFASSSSQSIVQLDRGISHVSSVRSPEADVLDTNRKCCISDSEAIFRQSEYSMLILLIVLILVFGFGGYRMGPGIGYYGGGGLSLVLTIVVILLLLKVI